MQMIHITYIAILPNETRFHVSKKLEAALAEISTWRSARMLTLKQEKTEFIIFNLKHKSRRMTEDIPLEVGQKSVCGAETVKYTLTHL